MECNEYMYVCTNACMHVCSIAMSVCFCVFLPKEGGGVLDQFQSQSSLKASRP